MSDRDLEKKEELEAVFAQLFGDIDEEPTGMEWDDADSLITLTDDDGNDVEFELADILGFEGNDYAVLLSIEEENAGQAVVLRLFDCEDEDAWDYEVVLDDRIVEAVYEMFREKYKDVLTFPPDE